MTGYGKGTLALPGKKITIEIKSLNSKQTDINLRLPGLLRSKEGALRQMMAGKLQRGKIDCSIYCEVTGIESAPQINKDLARGYLQQLKDLARDTSVTGDMISAIMRLPDVLQSHEEEIDEAQWREIEELAGTTVDQLIDFRASEGNRLAQDLSQRILAIRERLQQIPPLEAERKERLTGRLRKSLDQLALEVNEERYEQELIYYLEKYDITEEKVRLEGHLQYFDELMQEGGPIGKKLGFVGQEIGREINTLGSKANHAGIQKLVVEMKDELEKIKEQVLNIL